MKLQGIIKCEVLRYRYANQIFCFREIGTNECTMRAVHQLFKAFKKFYDSAKKDVL